MSELRIQGLDLHFAGMSVLRQINLTFRVNEVMALIGPNGAGKTALINCISGIYKPTLESRIYFGDERIDQLPSHRIAAKGVARTFQHAQLLDSLSVLENVLLGLTPHVRSGMLTHLARPWKALGEDRTLRARAMQLLGRCGIADIADAPAEGLSLGVRRRLDLARALAPEPSMLLLDEPASGLAHDERPLILELINISRREKDMGVVWIEHDLDLVIAAADRVTVMHHGAVIAAGQPQRSSEERQAVIDAYMKGAVRGQNDHHG